LITRFLFVPALKIPNVGPTLLCRLSNMQSNEHNTDTNPNELTDTEVAKLKATAFHEAGHAVLALALGRPIQKVTIAPAQLQTGGRRLGACKIQKGRSKATKDGLEDEVLILFAGMVAESHFTGQYSLGGAAQDLRFIRRLLASRATNERQVERLERRLLEKTEHLLSDEAHTRAIVLIAEELLKKETISGRAVRHFYDQATRSAK
jgi:ATP-dependent Zn protease